MKKLLLITTLMVGMLGASWIRVTGPSESPEPPEKTVESIDTMGIFIRTSVTGFNEKDTTVDNKAFKRINILEEPVDWDTTRIGRPQIPYIRLLIAVPDSANFDIKAYPSEPTLLYDYRLYPIPRIVFVSDSNGMMSSQEVYACDSLFYLEDTLYPGKFYEVRNDGHMRDQRVLEVFLYPVQYNPKHRLMYFYDGIDLKIMYMGTIIENTHGLGPFEDIGRDILLNYPGAHQEIIRQPLPHEPPAVHYYTELRDSNNVADYIIVTHEDFITDTQNAYWIQTFAQWRVSHNKFDVGIVRMQDIYAQFPSASPDSAEQLRNFLVYAYQHWKAPSMADNHFAYCLFIGDWDYVPTELRWVQYDTVVYLNAYEGFFRDIDGGSFEDIMLGRWPAKETDSLDLITIAQKTIDYEQSPSLGDWRRQGLLIAGPGDGNKWFDDLVSQSTPYFTDIGYDTLTLRWLLLDSLYSNPDTLFPDSIQKLLNLGEIIAAFYGHGGPFGWHFNYTNGNAARLNNDKRLPTILSYACRPASFHLDHPAYPDTHTNRKYCFGEVMLFNPNGGAVAFYGATSPIQVSEYNTRPMEQSLRLQLWNLGKAVVNTTPNVDDNCFCVLGDPALDLGDYTAYPDLPDLVVRPRGIDISLAPPYPYPSGGAAIPIKAMVFNVGGDSAHNVEVEFHITMPPQAQSMLLERIQIPEIAPRESVLVTNYWNTGETHPGFYGEIGNCKFTVTADPDSDITESWEKNNAASSTELVALYPNEPNWPMHTIRAEQPALANLDGVGAVEIVYLNLDSIHVCGPTLSSVVPWPKYFKDVEKTVLGDVNNDQTVEIIAMSPESIKVYDYQGNVMSGWPQPIPYANKEFNGYPALGAITTDNQRQVIVFLGIPEGGFQQPSKVLIYNGDGTVADSFSTSKQVYQSVSAGPAISDVNGDGNNDIVVAYDYSYAGGRYTQVRTDVFNRDGLQDSLNYGSGSVSSALTDVNGDGHADLITVYDDNTLIAYDAVTYQTLWATLTGGPISTSPAVGDINIYPGFDGNEIAFGNDAKEIWALRALDGSWWFPWPDSASGPISTSQALAYIDTTQNLDILIGSNDYYMHALTYEADTIRPFPLPLFGKPSSPLIGDIDGDGKSEIILTSRDGYLHVWENMQSQILPYTLEWPQFHHDYQRTGLYGWVSGISDGRVYPGELRPLQPTATISLYVEEESLYTQINVYNSEGKQVRTVANQTLTQGPQSLFWDGKDDRYILLPNGLYFIEIKVRDETTIMPISVNF